MLFQDFFLLSMNHLPLLVLGAFLVAKEGLCEKGAFEQILEVNLGIKSKFKFELC